MTELQTAPIAAEHLFASLHGLLRDDTLMQEHIAFEIVSSGGSIQFYAIVPSNVSSFVENQIYAQYPTSHISRVGDYVPESFKHGEYKIAHLSLAKEEYFPIKMYRDFEIDPLSSITSAMAEAKPGEDLWFQLQVKPIPDVWQGAGYEYVEAVSDGTYSSRSSIIGGIVSDIAREASEFARAMADDIAGRQHEGLERIYGRETIVKLTPAQELEIKSVEAKLAKMGFDTQIKLLAHAETEERTDSLLRSAVASMRQFSTSHLNAFKASTRDNDPARYQKYIERVFNPDKSFVLNIEELGSIYHLPSSSVETPGVAHVEAKKGEPPSNLPTENCNFIGTTVFRDRKVKFGISNEGDDRVRHLYLIGKSGTGKSTCFKNMIMQDIVAGHGVGVLDPHGELFEDVLEYIPEERIKDVVLVDPSDAERPVGINLLELEDVSQKNLMASALVSSMKQYFWSWGPRLEYLLNYSVLTLLEVPGTTMMGVTKLLTDTNYMNYILHFVKDPVVLKFWEEEYMPMKNNPRFVTEATAPIQNKINRFLSSSTIRNILAQRKSTIDFWDIINNKKILLINLSKGKIGADNANLLGALLVSRLQFYAMQRVKIPQEERKPFYLYVDEFQNFAGGDFESILSESRKYKLGLYLTHQYTSQLEEELLSAVFGNVGTIATFGLGAPDAQVLENEFAPYFDFDDIISLQAFHIYIKLMVKGQTSKPFSAVIPRPWIPEEAVGQKMGNREKVRDYSRQKYGVDRKYVEDKISKWVDYEFDKGKAIAKQYRDEAKRAALEAKKAAMEAKKAKEEAKEASQAV
jgi:hypothetical protein